MGIVFSSLERKMRTRDRRTKSVKVGELPAKALHLIKKRGVTPLSEIHPVGMVAYWRAKLLKAPSP